MLYFFDEKTIMNTWTEQQQVSQFTGRQIVGCSRSFTIQSV